MASLETAGSRPTILVATDFSQTAAAALEWAGEIARAGNARVLLVHALRLPTPVPGYLAPELDATEAIQAAALRQLQTVATAFAERGVETESHLGTGQAEEVILETADRIAADLVVMGTRGLTGVRHLLLGSTAEEVIGRARRPVLTIHPDDGHPRPIRTVLVPTDFTGDTELAVATVRKLLSPLAGEARLVLLHAYHLPVEYTAYGPIPTSTSFPGDGVADATRRIDEAAEALRAQGLAVEATVREGYAPEVVADEARQRGADLVAMGSHGRTGLPRWLLGSTAERVVQLAPCPVLTVRTGEG